MCLKIDGGFANQHYCVYSGLKHIGKHTLCTWEVVKLTRCTHYRYIQIEMAALNSVDNEVCFMLAINICSVHLKAAINHSIRSVANYLVFSVYT